MFVCVTIIAGYLGSSYVCQSAHNGKASPLVPVLRVARVTFDRSNILENFTKHPWPHVLVHFILDHHLHSAIHATTGNCTMGNSWRATSLLDAAGQLQTKARNDIPELDEHFGFLHA